MSSTIFFIVGGFGGCTGLEDCAPMVFSAMLSWLGGFFCGGFFCDGFAVFSDMLWWLGGFSAVLRCLFMLLMALALPPLVALLEVIWD
jgi:hypothetical protein